MFHNETVFVLGAGASWHYGYPTGEGLVESVISMANRFATYCKHRLESGDVSQAIPKYVQQKIVRESLEGQSLAWKAVQQECVTLAERLQTVRPLVIDYFLAWNKSLQPIGTLMIASSILECEAIWSRQQTNQNRLLAIKNQLRRPDAVELRYYDISKCKDDWCRFIVHKLVYGCSASSDLLQNKVSFITFNYDTSLEFRLMRSLKSIDLLNEQDVDTFFNDDRVIHVYGAVHSGVPTETDFIDANVAATLVQGFSRPPNPTADFVPKMQFLDRCLEASKTLLTIDPHTKENELARLALAKAAIAKSEVLYILGYGFDENNNKRVGLDPSLRRGPTSTRSVMFTNYLDNNIINKRASKLCFGRADQFMVSPVHGEPMEGGFFEKSVRDVYEALELDFDSLESELTAGLSV